MRRFAALTVATAALSVSLAATAGSAPSPGYTTVLAGTTGEAGWTLGMKREKVGEHRGICIEIDIALPDGSGGSAGDCAAGSLSLAGNVLSSGVQLGGDTTVGHAVGGIVPATARRVVVEFADGKKVRLKAKRPPKEFRKALGTTIRVYAGDALAAPNPNQRSVVAFDRKGKRVARKKLS